MAAVLRLHCLSSLVLSLCSNCFAPPFACFLAAGLTAFTMFVCYRFMYGTLDYPVVFYALALLALPLRSMFVFVTAIQASAGGLQVLMSGRARVQLARFCQTVCALCEGLTPVSASNAKLLHAPHLRIPACCGSDAGCCWGPVFHALSFTSLLLKEPLTLKGLPRAP